jgi:hypothetical protein
MVAPLPSLPPIGGTKIVVGKRVALGCGCTKGKNRAVGGADAEIIDEKFGH